VNEAAAGRAWLAGWLLPPATADGDAFTGCEQTRKSAGGPAGGAGRSPVYSW
jgi:hypothetical protein